MRTALVLALIVLHGSVPARAEPSSAGDSATSPRRGTAIKTIIPHHRLGEESCFAAMFSGRTIDMEDWAHLTHEVLPDVIVGGQPATRPVPRALPDQDISRVMLHLTYQNRRRDRGDNFLFTVMAGSNSLKQNLFARSGCDWSGWSEQEQREILPETRLSCGIDCDGGTMTVERIAGTGSVNLRFHALSMQAGCEGGGRYRVGTGPSSQTVAFRLERVPLNVCRAAKAWRGKQ